MEPVATALYRRYRPEAFAEMIGQSQVTEPLMTALRSERIGHAYLFSGPRGCGKTTSARILARCLNCVEGPTDTPCGACPSCVELSRDGGGSLDVVEIDAASHGGVDDARDLRERAVFAPARDRFKIFIIDEAHMVTPGGFNALLKIVEEPPPHVKFVFATTEPDKVIGTIRSRTHHYPFRLIAPAALIDYAQSLCDSESIEVEPGVLPLVVRSGGGSVRDTLSILDQLIAGSEGGRVTADRAAGLLGFTHGELLDDVVAALGAGDAAAAFRATDRVVQTGQDPRRFVEDLLERLRDLIVVSATTVEGAAAVFRGVPEDQLQRMFEQAQVFGAGDLSRIADVISEALDTMAGATAPRVQLELMIARALVRVQTPGETNAPPRESEPAPTRTPEPVRPAAAEASATEPSATGAPAAAPDEPPPGSTTEAGNAMSGAEGPAQEEPPAAVERAAPAPVSAPASGATPSAAEAARAAREFLATDTSGAPPFGRPVNEVIEKMAEGGAPARPRAQSEEPVEGEQPPQDAAPAQAGASAGFEELNEMWPELLEELLEGDREAWNAVRNVNPLGLDGDVLTVGVSSKSDLEVFKASGAGPLRETILAAIGVRVRYVPKRVPLTTAPDVAGPQGQSASREAATPASSATEPPASDNDDPERAGAAETSRVSADRPDAAQRGPEQPDPEQPDPRPDSTPREEPVSKAPGADADVDGAWRATPGSGAETKSAVNYADDRPAPAWADPDPPELAAEDDPYADQGEDPYLAATVAAQAPEASEPQTSEPQKPEPHELDSQRPGPAPVPGADAAPEASRPAPSFTRYGEAVVREVLGAKFIEERPLPENREG